MLYLFRPAAKQLLWGKAWPNSSNADAFFPFPRKKVPLSFTSIELQKYNIASFLMWVLDLRQKVLFASQESELELKCDPSVVNIHTTCSTCVYPLMHHIKA